tara:strand:+ start:792 stop:1538 length:747 start_codon:yes stop_codon:yes gene_type:complete
VNDKELSYEINKDFYYFNILTISDKKLFINYIKEIVKSYNHYTNNKNTIIFDHFECLNGYFQELLKVIIEKASITSSFILITNNLTNTNNSIQSRSISIRIPLPTNYDKFIHIQNILHKDKVDYNSFLLLKDCNSVGNIDNIVNYHKYGSKYDNITEVFSYKLIEIFNGPTLNIEKIKELSYDIKQLHILKDIILYIFDLVYSYYNNINKDLLIKETARYENIINKSYRDIIYLESYLIRLYKIVNEL